MAEISSIPLTRNVVSADRAGDIRQAVRRIKMMATDNDVSKLATEEDAQSFLDFLLDPAISVPIYTLPTALSLGTVRTFIEEHLLEREQGTGLLVFNFDQDGNFGRYTDVTIWPEWAAGVLGGAVHPDRQGQRKDVEGARLGFDWMFEALGLDVICETAALDNFRTGRLLDRLGYRRVGQTISKREDGSQRPSLVWEIRREEWKSVI